MMSDLYNVAGMCWALPVDEPQCGHRAELHILWLDATRLGEHQLTGMCVRHARSFMRHNRPRLVAVHPYRTDGNDCDMPGTRWDLDPNVCVIDDSGVDPFQVWIYRWADHGITS